MTNINDRDPSRRDYTPSLPTADRRPGGWGSHAGQGSGGEGFRATWRVAKELFPFGQTAGLVAQVSKSDHYPFPRYRVAVGFKTEDGFVHRNLSIRVDGQRNLQPVLDGSIGTARKLLEEAEEWIAGDAAYEANNYIDEREQKDRKAAGLATPAVVTGKTAKKHAKAAAAKQAAR